MTTVTKKVDIDLLKKVITKLIQIKGYSVKLCLLREEVTSMVHKDTPPALIPEQLEKAFNGVMDERNFDSVQVNIVDFCQVMLSPYTYWNMGRTLEELDFILTDYIGTFNSSLKAFFSEISVDELGSNKYYNELPLNDAEPFVNKLLKILPSKGEYFVSIYDLSDELVVYFDDLDEAKNFAKDSAITPSTVFKTRAFEKDGQWFCEEITCY